MYIAMYSSQYCQMGRTLLYTMLLSVIFISGPALADECRKAEGFCGCQTGSGVKIDFSTYKGPDHLHPMFRRQLADDQAFYTYDPCTPIPKGKNFTNCEGYQLCQTKDGKDYAIGNAESSEYKGDPLDGTLRVIYKDQTTGRTGQVDLRCGDLDFKPAGEQKPMSKIYNFTMSSPLVCATSPGGLSPGSVLLIIFFVLLLIYIIGGMLYLRFAHGARGKEQIPNYDFWEDFPLLVRDGVVFVSKGCKPDTTYQQI